jgi:hypothetical protein
MVIQNVIDERVMNFVDPRNMGISKVLDERIANLKRQNQ